MNKEQKKIALILLLAAVFTYIWYTRDRDRPSFLAPREGAKVLTNRMWVDKLPTNPKDTYNAYLFTVRAMGIHDSAESIFKHLIEIYHFKVDGGTIAFQFPHDERRASSSFSVEKLSQPKGPFDLKLTHGQDPQNGGQEGVYYSSSKWRKDTVPDIAGDSIPALIPPGVSR